MSKECALCKEKQSEINRILKAYAKDKKMYRYVILGIGILLLLVTAFGVDGIRMAMGLAENIVK